MIEQEVTLSYDSRETQTTKSGRFYIQTTRIAREIQYFSGFRVALQNIPTKHRYWYV